MTTSYIKNLKSKQFCSSEELAQVCYTRLNIQDIFAKEKFFLYNNEIEKVIL